MTQTWLDRLTMPFAPRWTLRRVRARVAAELLARHYEAASTGRRTSGWRRTGGDANAAVGGGLSQLREVARDLVRNNPWATGAVDTIADDAIGWGITATPKKGTASAANMKEAARVWKAWAETRDCDAEGRQTFAGIEKLVMRSIVESGEVLIRRRWRRPSDGFAIPMQLQVLEADFLDSMKDGIVTPTGGRIIQGVEFDPIGRRVGYWLYQEHPGSTFVGRPLSIGRGASVFIPATEILHVYETKRPGQVRGPSWYAPIILRLKDLDEYEDAALMKQKIAACLAALTTDIDGSAPAIGTPSSGESPATDSLEPGMILNLPPGRAVTVIDPPSVSEHDPFTRGILRAIARGLGVTYEDLTGDFSQVNFSSARMSRLRYWSRQHDWRWNMLIPQFCDPVWAWAMQAAAIMGLQESPMADWTAPPMPMIEPDREGLAYQRNIRSGLMTLSEAIRERGYDPEALLAEMAADNKTLDRLGLILDSDARRMTQAGQAQGTASSSASASTANGNGNGTPAPAKAGNGNGAR